MSADIATPSNEAGGDVVVATARAGAPDRYVAALLAPRPVRGDLIALAAYSAEIEKIPRQVSDPHLGEIRLQWWREQLAASTSATPFEKSGHPVADAMIAVMRRHHLPLQRFNDHLDATVHALYADAPENDTQQGLELEMKDGGLFALATQIIGGTETETCNPILKGAAQAFGLMKLALDLPYALARGRVPLPPSGQAPADFRNVIGDISTRARTHLAHVRAAYPEQHASVKSALLPVALVEPYLRVLSRASHDPARDIADIAPLTRAWHLAKTHWRGRF
jgi:15-cis-phytoene synthase